MSPSMSTFNSIQVNVNPLPICFWANNNGHVYFQIKSMSTYSQFVSFQIKLPICILLYVLLSVKWLVRSKEQLVPAYMPIFPVKTASSIRRTVCTYLHCCDIDQAAGSIQRAACIILLSMSPGQTASSNQRTVCTCLSVWIFNQATSSIQRTTCIFLYVYVSGQVPSSIQRTACTCLVSLFPVK